MTATVLVTGGAGFIGRAVTKALDDAGFSVRVGVRGNGSSGTGSTVLCDLDKPEQIAGAVRNTSTVVHCAYGDEAAMPRQCAALLAAMTSAGVNRLVYFSSIAVYGDALKPKVDDPIDASGLAGTYASAKAECEQLVREWVEGDADRHAIILRPGIVYGAGSPFWIEKLSRRIEAGVWGDFGPLADGLAPLVHVDDVAVAATAATRRLAETAEPLQAVDLIGPEMPTWNEYSRRVAASMGAAPLRCVGPARLGWGRLCAFPAKVFRRLGLPGFERAALAPTGGELQIMSRRAVYDRERAKAVLGSAPSIGLDEGLSRSFEDQETRPLP